MSVFVTLQEKRLPFDIKTIDLSSDVASEPSYAKLSLTHRVPTLVVGDFSLSESSTITEYLVEVYPGQALYPAEVKSAAQKLFAGATDLLSPHTLLGQLSASVRH